MIESALDLPLSDDSTLLREINHRINNEFACIIGIVTQAAGRAENEEVKAALKRVAAVIHTLVDINHALQMPEYDTYVSAAEYLKKLCVSISRSRLDHMKVKMVLVASPLQLRSDHCWRLGMIVYELITNATRHAFTNGSGEIRVELFRIGSIVECRVLDNGSAPAKVQPGRGLKIVSALAKTLAGGVEHQFGAGGTRSILTFPWCCEPHRGAHKRALQ
ncbi:sensor histidine kinase [Bradyrhizobium tropiciagri]|uniref:sensor histidine kinase n=1 Tax=Bradyrhizobium tropiciagri TaxID=312253 RepID=UPI00067E4395|nr:sensor histidine kinase [Bradyrhizobium tropiciagri]